jgi:hypothetical protein
LPIDKNIKGFLFSWIAIAFIPPGITTGAPQAMRSFNILPAPQILEALGIVSLGVVLSKQRIIWVLYHIAIGICLIASAYMLYFNYFLVFPKTNSQDFQYALHQAVTFVSQRRENYDKVVISNTNALFESYMFYLYDTTYKPSLYLQRGGTKSGGFGETHSIDTIVFMPLNSAMSISGKVLYVGNVGELPKDVKQIKTFYNLNGKAAVVAGEKN